MSRLRVGLLANPTAASGAALRAGREVARLLRLAGISTVDVSGSSARVARARALELRDSLTALIVVGGDGTVALGAEIAVDTPVRLGIVAVGSGNDFARSIGLPVGDIEASVRQILHALSRPAVTIDTIAVSPLVDGEPQGRSVVVGNVSLGFDALVNARANRARHPGMPRYMLGIAQELSRFAPLPYWMEIDGGERFDVDATILTIANTGVFGGGMKIDPGARVDDGELDIVRVAPMSRRSLVRFFPRVYRGTHTTLDEFTSTPARTVRVGLRDGATMRSYADGEPNALLPLEASVMPGALRILADSSLRRREADR